MTKNLFEQKGFSKGTYYLVDRESVEKLFEDAGYGDEDDVPNFMVVNGVECLFTENFIEKEGVEYEIVMVAEGFSWSDIAIYDHDDEHAEGHHHG